MNCPNCGKQNRAGLLLCEHCGHQLITLSDLSLYKTTRLDMIPLPWKPYEPVDAIPRFGTKTLHQASFVTLDIVDASQKLHIPATGHVSLGRVDKVAEWQPTVDLTPYDAVSKGVSRMHADLFFEKDQVFVLELGSVNGTLLNGNKVMLGMAQQIHNGDELELGRLRIRVYSS